MDATGSQFHIPELLIILISPWYSNKAHWWDGPGRAHMILWPLVPITVHSKLR